MDNMKERRKNSFWWKEIIIIIIIIFFLNINVSCIVMLILGIAITTVLPPIYERFIYYC